MIFFWWDIIFICAVWQILKGFLTQRLNYILQFSSCGPWRVFSHLNSPSYRALGRYRHTPSSKQFSNILCWLKMLNYCPDGGNGNFHCSSYFLKATSLICKAKLSFAAHKKYILWFFSLWWMIKGIWALFSTPIYISVKKRKSWLDNFMFIIIPWMETYFRDILLIKIIVSIVYLRKNNHNEISPI